MKRIAVILAGGREYVVLKSTVDRYADVVVDLETLGVNRDAPVIQVGAATVKGSILYTYDGYPSLTEQLKGGRHVDESTLMWWISEDQTAARLQVFGNMAKSREPVETTLNRFATWIRLVSEGRELRIWGNGPSFDLALLGGLYDDHGIERPWKHWQERDLRTALDLLGRLEPEFVGVKHDGVDDAVHELTLLHLALNASPTHNQETPNGG